MKIIKKGTIPKKEIPKWVGKEITCFFCNTVIKLEEGDFLYGNTDGSTYTVCPICKRGVRVEDEIK